MDNIDEDYSNFLELSTCLLLTIVGTRYVNNNENLTNNFEFLILYAACLMLFGATTLARRAGVISRNSAEKAQKIALSGATGLGIVLSTNLVMKSIPPMLFGNRALREKGYISESTGKLITEGTLILAGASILKDRALRYS